MSDKTYSVNVLVIGITDDPDALTPMFRRSFDYEIALCAPDVNERLEILSILTRNLKIGGELELSKIARSTVGYVAADLVSLCSQAGFAAIDRSVEKKGDWWRERPKDEDIERLNITMLDFEEALKMVQPLSMKEFSPIPDITWDDVGGLSSLKKIFQSYVINHIRYPERNGVKLAARIFLYGPPGCGKTLVAKALANAAGVNFIHIKGLRLLNKNVKESGLEMKTLFRRARRFSPCIIFFDEVDVLARKHERKGAWGVQQQLIQVDASGREHDENYELEVVQQFYQLLFELDEGDEQKGVFVIAATNRPDLVDRALLRPEMSDLIYIPLPTLEERILILKVLARKMPISDDVDLVSLAQKCFDFNGADLAFLMDRAAAHVVTEVLNCKDLGMEIAKPNTIKASHFELVLQTIHPSVSKEDKEYCELFSKSR